MNWMTLLRTGPLWVKISGIWAGLLLWFLGLAIFFGIVSLVIAIIWDIIALLAGLALLNFLKVWGVLILADAVLITMLGLWTSGMEIGDEIRWRRYVKSLK